MVQRCYWQGEPDRDAMRKMMEFWLDVLEPFTADEVEVACRGWVLDNPDRRANPGHIRKSILSARGESSSAPRVTDYHDNERRKGPRVSRERAAEIIREVGLDVSAGLIRKAPGARR